MNAATRPPGNFARFLRLLRTPVHLPGWGKRRHKHRPLPVVIGSPEPLTGDCADITTSVLSPPPAAMSSHPSSAPQAAPVALHAATPTTAAPASTAIATGSQPPSRITRSLEEVRADLARMREEARARAARTQAQAKALAQWREAERIDRDNSFAPTDFMDFDGLAAPAQQPSKRADTSFAATDFQGLDDGASSPGERDDGFGATAFLPPSALPRRGGAQ